MCAASVARGCVSIGTWALGSLYISVGFHYLRKYLLWSINLFGRILMAFTKQLVGVTALHLGYSVATLNARHFQLIPGLTIVQL